MSKPAVLRESEDVLWDMVKIKTTNKHDTANDKTANEAQSSMSMSIHILPSPRWRNMPLVIPNQLLGRWHLYFNSTIALLYYRTRYNLPQ